MWGFKSLWEHQLIKVYKMNEIVKMYVDGIEDEIRQQKGLCSRADLTTGITSQMGKHNLYFITGETEIRYDVMSRPYILTIRRNNG
jgi:hypothetical protein